MNKLAKQVQDFFTHIFRYVFDGKYRESLRKQKAYRKIAMDPTASSQDKAVAIAAASLEQILRDEKAQENARIWGQYFDRKFRGKRFTAEQAYRVVRGMGAFDQVSIQDHLHLLTMFKVLVRQEVRIGSKPTIYYRAVLSPAHRAAILKQEAELLRKRAEMVEKDI